MAKTARGKRMYRQVVYYKTKYDENKHLNASDHWQTRRILNGEVDGEKRVGHFGAFVRYLIDRYIDEHPGDFRVAEGDE